jgi:hypothetical protein
MTSKLQTRLTRQLAARGVKGASGMAVALLKKDGNMDQSGKLTAKGRERQAMGADGRAKDRASKVSGKPASAYKYNAKTNTATLKKK